MILMVNHVKIEIEEYSDKFKDWAADCHRKYWRSTLLVSRGKVYHAEALPGFAALMDGKPVGLITYHIKKKNCEIITINSEIEKKGIASALIDAVKKKAISERCLRLWLITTNDNIEAIRYYQKRGFELAAFHRNAIEHSRKLKPSIPLTGKHGIPIRDEIEFEMML